MSDAPPPAVRLILVEDHEAVRERVLARLRAEPWIEVLGGAATVDDAIELVTATEPDIAVLDVNLGTGNGIALCRTIRKQAPATQCIFYTSVALGSETASVAGAAAVVLKQLVGDQLLTTIRMVAAADHGD